MKKIILSIEGMTCSACSNGLEKYLNKQKGINNANVNLVMSNATIEYDEDIVNIAIIEEYVKKAGFKSLGEFKEIKIDNNKKNKYILIIFSILIIIFMYITMGNMIKLPTIPVIDVDKFPVNYTTCSLIFSLIFIIYGYDILKNGYLNLIHKTPNMDTLVALGVISSFIYSFYNTILIYKGDIHLAHNLYYEATIMVIYFVKLGRYLDRITKDKTKEAIQKLVSITPKTATIIKNGIEKEVTIDEVQVGDTVISRAGDVISVDGIIINGNTHLDESFITGESKAVKKTINDKVIAGSLNYDGYIEYKALKIGPNSTISEIVKLVVESSNSKPRIAKLADKVSGYFVPFVIILAFLTFIVTLYINHNFQNSLITFITILVVSCPCSLGLATPLAIVLAEGICASNGIVVKKGTILETAKNVDTVVFDKTGTLTYGTLKISKIYNYSSMSEEKLLQIIASIEYNSNHPIAKALTNYLNENKIERLAVKNFKNIENYGIEGTVNNSKVTIGSYKITEKLNVKNNHKEDEKNLYKSKSSIVYVIQNDKIIALIGLNDILRDNVSNVIKWLNNNKIDTVMLTGDNIEVANIIAKNIGIKKVIANTIPQEKNHYIKDLKEQGKYVMMIGDGINDSPALKTADIGISLNSGTDIADYSSDVILTSNKIDSIINLIKISKSTNRIIKQNLFWAFFYNILMIPIAMNLFKSIKINPMIASISMTISSLTVILNTLRLLKVKINK